MLRTKTRCVGRTVCVQITGEAVRIWETGNGMVKCAGDAEVRGSQVVGSAGKPGREIGIQCMGQNGVHTDRWVFRGRKSTAEEGSSSTELSPQCSEQPPGLCGWEVGPTPLREKALGRQDSGITIPTATTLFCCLRCGVRTKMKAP